MISSLKATLAALAILSTVGSAHAITIFVDQDSGDDNDDGLTFEDAVATVTHGFSLLGGSGTLVIGPGVYSPSNGEFYPAGVEGDLVMLGAGSDQAILDGELASGVLDLGSEGVTIDVQGIAVINGNESIGGGVHLQDPAVASFTDCRFENNTASIGGALHIQINSAIDVQLTIVDCEFLSNAATIGGGIQFQENGSGTHTLEVDRSTFRANGHSGIHFQTNNGTAIGHVTNSVFAGHPATALSTDTSDLDLVNSSFDSNTTALISIGPIEVANSIFWNNGTEISGNGGTISFSIIEGLEIDGHTDGGNNTNVDPLFDANQRLSSGSPAIDQGSDSAAAALGLILDIDRNDRVHDFAQAPNGAGGSIDRGAQEYPGIFADGFETGDTSLWGATIL